MAIEARLYSENLGFALKCPQELSVENGCGFFIPRNKKSHQFQSSSDHQKNLGFFSDEINSGCELVQNNCTSDLQSMAFSQDLSAQIEKQRMEIDQFIRIQNERLRLTLQEHRKQQTAQIINRYESKTRLLLRQRDEQIAEASNRAFELENLLKRMEMENQTWQRLAKEKEAMVASLSGAIQRLKETAVPPSNGADDAESCCQNAIDEEKTENEEFKSIKKMICRLCNNRSSSVVILPCRHLCSCKDCEAFLHSCPVCGNVKKATIDVLV